MRSKLESVLIVHRRGRLLSNEAAINITNRQRRSRRSSGSPFRPQSEFRRKLHKALLRALDRDRQRSASHQQTSQNPTAASNVAVEDEEVKSQLPCLSYQFNYDDILEEELILTEEQWQEISELLDESPKFQPLSLTTPLSTTPLPTKRKNNKNRRALA
ncbi:hypothetical protein BGW41_008206, partial [Actinomortierella wolfii]